MKFQAVARIWGTGLADIVSSIVERKKKKILTVIFSGVSSAIIPILITIYIKLNKVFCIQLMNDSGVFSALKRIYTIYSIIISLHFTVIF